MPGSPTLESKRRELRIFAERDYIFWHGLKSIAEGTRPDLERIANMVKVQAPKTAGEVRSFLGMANTCHEYIPDYAALHHH